jgi:WD40 repeat protein
MENTNSVKKILILAANPKGTSRLRLDQEVRDITEGLQLAKNRDQFALTQIWAVRPRDIHRALLKIEPHIVHFSGHGTGEEGLVFEDETGRSKLIKGEALAKLFALFSDQLECVVLNGCYSEVQAKLISQYIINVIGVPQAVGDATAIEFSVGFYDALGAGRSVSFAYQLGCNAIASAEVSKNLMPVLISNDTDLRNRKATKAEPHSLMEPHQKFRRSHKKRKLCKRFLLGLGTTLVAICIIVGVRIYQLTAPLRPIQMIEYPGDPGYIGAVAFSPDGKTLISGAEKDKTIKLWDVESGRLIKSFIGHSSGVRSIAVSKDGTIASGSFDKTIKIWELDGTLKYTLTGHNGYIWSVAISPDGKTLVSGSEDKTIKVWNLVNGELIRTLEGYKDAVLSVCIAEGSDSQLIAGTTVGFLKLWNLETGHPISSSGRSDELVPQWSVACGPKRPQGIYFARSTGDGQVIIDMEDGYNINTHSKGAIYGISLSPRENILASTTSEGQVNIWDVTWRGNQDVSWSDILITSLYGHNASVVSIAFSPDGKLLASGGFDQKITIHKLEKFLGSNL